MRYPKTEQDVVDIVEEAICKGINMFNVFVVSEKWLLEDALQIAFQIIFFNKINCSVN